MNAHVRASVAALALIASLGIAGAQDEDEGWDPGGDEAVTTSDIAAGEPSDSLGDPPQPDGEPPEETPATNDGSTLDTKIDNAKAYLDGLRSTAEASVRGYENANELCLPPGVREDMISREMARLDAGPSVRSWDGRELPSLEERVIRATDPAILGAEATQGVGAGFGHDSPFARFGGYSPGNPRPVLRLR